MSRLLLGVTGGIAAYKACEIVRAFARNGHDVRVVATRNALRFVSSTSLEAVSGHPVRSRLFDSGEESEISHIALADWADAVVVAPATAHFIARAALGLADDLLTTICLATRAPLVLAPAMNVHMYRHPATQKNLATLDKRGAILVGPDAGELACGWEGEGRLVSTGALEAAVDRAVGGGELRGEIVLITAGPTAEPVDPVRVLTNRSSGKMGFALAREAVRRGADVVLVSGPVSLPTPFGVDRIDVETTEEMHGAVLRAMDRATLIIAAAAVSDYRVAAPAEQKIKRQRSESLALELVRNPDVSASVAERKGGRFVVGFAAETSNLIANATDKLARKGYDLIVANDVSRKDIGFDSDRNEVVVIGPAAGAIVPLPEGPKSEIARGIFDRIGEVRGR